MRRNLVRFGIFCRRAHINRTQLFQVLNNKKLKVTTIHGIDYIYGNSAAINVARKNLGIESKKMRNR